MTLSNLFRIKSEEEMTPNELKVRVLEQSIGVDDGIKVIGGYLYIIDTNGYSNEVFHFFHGNVLCCSDRLNSEFDNSLDSLYELLNLVDCDVITGINMLFCEKIAEQDLNHGYKVADMGGD